MVVAVGPHVLVRYEGINNVDGLGMNPYRIPARCSRGLPINSSAAGARGGLLRMAFRLTASQKWRHASACTSARHGHFQSLAF